MHLSIEKAVALAELLKPVQILSDVRSILAQLDELLVFQTVQISVELNFVSKLILDALLHLCLNL